MRRDIDGDAAIRNGRYREQLFDDSIQVAGQVIVRHDPEPLFDRGVQQTFLTVAATAIPLDTRLVHLVEIGAIPILWLFLIGVGNLNGIVKGLRSSLLCEPQAAHRSGGE